MWSGSEATAKAGAGAVAAVATRGGVAARGACSSLLILGGPILQHGVLARAVVVPAVAIVAAVITWVAAPFVN